jgi:hypothetical protein
MKTMQAIIDGNWLLPFSWIEECLTKGAILKEDSFEFDGDQYSDDEAPHRARLSREHNVHTSNLCVVCSFSVGIKTV